MQPITNRAMIDDGYTLCSQSLNDHVSYYSQFEVCEDMQPKIVDNFCMPATSSITAELRTQTLFSSVKPGESTSFSVCHYQVFNPNPRRAIILNVHTGSSMVDIGVYY